jgi:putative FmdB family regulatory protein
MPTYQYRCLNCKRRFEIFLLYSEYGTKAIQCTYCGSEKIQRRIGRIRFARSDDSRLDDLSDPSGLEGLEDDPKSLGRLMRKMKNEMGSEIGEDVGPEFDEVVDRLEKGQSPEEIEQALPDLGETAAGGSDFGGGDDF